MYNVFEVTIYNALKKKKNNQVSRRKARENGNGEMVNLV